MKAINIFFIFILNFKLIFCQRWPQLDNFLIRHSASNLVLDVKDGVKDNGTSIILWQQTSNSNQLWSAQGKVLKSLLSLLNLETYGPVQSGSALIQAKKDPADTITWVREEGGYIVSVDGSFAITVDNNPQPGSLVKVAPKEVGNTNQIWEVVTYY